MATMPLRRIARWVAGQGNINRPKSGINLSGQIKPATPNTRFSCAIRQNSKLSMAAIPGEGMIPLKTSFGVERKLRRSPRSCRLRNGAVFRNACLACKAGLAASRFLAYDETQVSGNCTVTGSWKNPRTSGWTPLDANGSGFKPLLLPGGTSCTLVPGPFRGRQPSCSSLFTQRSD